MTKKIVRTIGIILVVFVVQFVFGGFSFQTAPYSLATSPMMAYRITGEEHDTGFFADDPNSIHGYAIIQRKVIIDPELQQDVVSLLTSRFIYGGLDTMCFGPTIAIRLGEGSEQVDALICLECDHIYFFRGDQVEAMNLNFVAAGRIERLYSRLFPGHNLDNSDADAMRVTDARNAEREVRREAQFEATSRPWLSPGREVTGTKTR